MFLKNDEPREEVGKGSKSLRYSYSKSEWEIPIWQAVIECLLYVRCCTKGFLSALTQQPSDGSDAPFSPLGSSPYISCSNKLLCWGGKSVWLDRTDFHTRMVCGAHCLSSHCSSQTLFFVLGYILSHPSGFLYLFSEFSSCMTSSPAFLITTQCCLNFVHWQQWSYLLRSLKYYVAYRLP